MVIDDNVKSNEMNSRHAAILGLRNVLKTAANYDVTTLTLPLLLTHEMTEVFIYLYLFRYLYLE